MNNDFLLEGGRTGVLLIHGLTGTPDEMRLLARGLHRAGYTVYSMQLPGHCGTEADLIATTWVDWYSGVCVAADHLSKRVDQFFVAGLCMGALLALKLAADHPDRVLGVGAFSTLFRVDGWSMPFYARLCFLLNILKPLGIGRAACFIKRAPYGLKDESLRKRVAKQMRAGDNMSASLPVIPWWALAETYKLASVVRRELHRITSSCLVIHAIEDDIASLESNAAVIVQQVPGALKTVWLKDSYHVVTIDREWRTVLEHTVKFLGTVVAGQMAPAPVSADLGPIR